MKKSKKIIKQVERIKDKEIEEMREWGNERTFFSIPKDHLEAYKMLSFNTHL